MPSLNRRTQVQIVDSERIHALAYFFRPPFPLQTPNVGIDPRREVPKGPLRSSDSEKRLEKVEPYKIQELEIKRR